MFEFYVVQLHFQVRHQRRQQLLQLLCRLSIHVSQKCLGFQSQMQSNLLNCIMFSIFGSSQVEFSLYFQFHHCQGDDLCGGFGLIDDNVMFE